MKKNGNSDAMSRLGENIALDLTSVLEDCMGDLDLLEQLIRLFKQNAVEFIGAAKLGIKNADYIQIKQAAHKIKCGLRMMHAETLYDIVIEIHDACNTDQDLDRITYLNALFITDYLEVERVLDTAFKELDNN